MAELSVQAGKGRIEEAFWNMPEETWPHGMLETKARRGAVGVVRLTVNLRKK